MAKKQHESGKGSRKKGRNKVKMDRRKANNTLAKNKARRIARNLRKQNKKQEG